MAALKIVRDCVLYQEIFNALRGIYCSAVPVTLKQLYRVCGFAGGFEW